MKKLTLATLLFGAAIGAPATLLAQQDDGEPSTADEGVALERDAATGDDANAMSEEGIVAEETPTVEADAAADESAAEAIEVGSGEAEEPTPGALVGDAAAGAEKSAVCAACHGGDGKALQPNYPNLGGQHPSYLAKQLTEYRDGERVNALMSGQAANLSDQDILDLAAHYGQLPKIEGVAAEENLALGERIYRGGISAAGVPACIGCHGPAGLGNPAAVYPMLSGQQVGYTAEQLRYFRSGERANDPNAMMRSIAHRLTDAEIDAVSNYIAGLHSGETISSTRDEVTAAR